MNPQRWQEVEALYHQALKDGAVLERADPDLRREVESLLAQHASHEGPLDRPAADLLTDVESTGLTVGSQLGPYRIEAAIGAGGMGEVYRASDTRLHRTVAIKILPHDKLADGDRKRRFLQEARAASSLNHPNIVAIHDISTDGGRDFMVMEYVRGQTLRDLIKSRPIPIEEVARYGVQIASALAAAHAAGIVHRDIKPANIMVTLDAHGSDSQVKVLDFGLAKLTDRGIRQDSETRTIASETSPGTVMGTASYMSPEQTRGEGLDGRSDIFSLGTVLYEAATGRLPFEGPSMLAVMHAIAAERPAPPSETRSGLPKAFDSVIERALAKDKDQRYASAKELMDALQPLTHGTTAARRIAIPGLRRKWWIAAAVVMLLAGAAIAGFYRWRSPSGIDSIAVLPLVSTANDAGLETLADGFTEDLINSLSQTPDLKVMAPSAVFRYKGQILDPQSIGKQLSVGAVLIGRMSRNGDQTTVRVNLVNVSDGSELWGKEYNRDNAQVQAIGQEMAQEIADRARPGGKNQARLATHHIANPQAYELYLQGRRGIRQLTNQGLKQAATDFQNAIKIDPDYAAAWAGLADAYSYMALFEMVPPGEVMSKAKDDATQALKLDPQAAEAYTSLGIVELAYEWKWKDAERDFRRALEINPADGFTHHFLGHYYEFMGNFQEAQNQMQLAFNLDPLSPMFGGDLAWALFANGHTAEAVQRFRKTLELDPDDGMLHAELAEVLLKGGDPKEIMDHVMEALRLPDKLAAVGLLSAVVCNLGKPEIARDLLHELQAASKKGYVSPTEFAETYFSLGETAEGLRWMRAAVAERSFQIGFSLADIMYDPVRENPEFVALMSQTGFPEQAWRRPTRLSK